MRPQRSAVRPAAVPLAALLIAIPLLSGCVAAALPVIAAGGLISTRSEEPAQDAQQAPRVALPADPLDSTAAAMAGDPANATVRQATFSDGSTVTVTNMLPRPALAAPAAAAPVEAVAVSAPEPAPTTSLPNEPAARLTQLRELPPPSAAAAAAWSAEAAGEYFAFADFAAAQAAIPAAGAERKSALLADSATMEAATRDCSIHPAAVLIDLDPGDELFDPDRAGAGNPALATRLAGLRADGVTIGWISSRTADRAGAVRKALKASGLDPEGRDELVLLRFAEERKQTRRDDFARAYCVVAIAGDQRADFDELFAYLRDPAAAQPLETLVGQGWFLVSPPIQ